MTTPLLWPEEPLPTPEELAAREAAAKAHRAAFLAGYQAWINKGCPPAERLPRNWTGD